MEDSMINMPDLVFDEKIGNKRVRDGEDEIHLGRLEKRPSGILGVNDGGDYTGDGDDEGGDSDRGIIDTFISNVFHKNRNGTEGEVEVGGEVKTEDEDKKEDLGVDGGGGRGGDGGGGDGTEGGGGIISSFFSNVFHHNGSVDEEGDQAKSDHLGGGPGGDGGGGEPEHVNAEKLSKKKDEVVDLPSKDPKGDALKLKPDDYAERVFFLNNN